MQIPVLWFDTIGDWNQDHNLPQLRRACLPLHLQDIIKLYASLQGQLTNIS